jgi:hypothetical protein
VGHSLIGKQGKCSHTCVFGKQFECEHTRNFAPGGGKNACQNACWGASPNPVVCGPALTLRALTLGQNVPKQKYQGTAKTVPLQIRKCRKYLAISVQDI